MNLRFTTRRYIESDLDNVWELHINGLVQTQSYIADPKLDADLNDIKKHYLENNGEFLVAVLDNKILGMGAIRKIDNDTAELKRMRVKTDYQGQGVGSVILESLIERAKKLWYKNLILDTSSKQESAQNLYKKFGFKEEKRVKTEDFETIHFLLKLI